MNQTGKFEPDPELYPFQSKRVGLKNGASLHYLDQGEGPALLLLHGNPTWSFLYRKIIKGLEGKFRCIAPDYPGFGLSTAPAGYGFTAAEHADSLALYIEELDLRDITIMMQDWGGPIGFSLALRFPERVRGFVIGNTWAWPIERLGQKIFSRIMGGPVGRTLAGCCNGIVRLFMWKGVASGLDRRALEMYLAPFRRKGDRAPTHIFPKQILGAGPFLAEIYQGLPSLGQKPALIVWGERDFAFQEPERSRFEKLFPDHRTVFLPKAGHFIQEDAPDEIVSSIKGWFADHWGLG